MFRLARLAVSLARQGKGSGADLLLAGGERALAVVTEVGGVALAIDAKDEKAARWYERFGAMPLLDDQLKLILPLATIAAAIRRATTGSPSGRGVLPKARDSKDYSRMSQELMRREPGFGPRHL